MTAPGPAPLSPAQLPSCCVLAVVEVAGVKPVRPTDRADLTVLWVGSPGWVPAAVKSGVGGPHDHDLVVPVSSPPAAAK